MKLLRIFVCPAFALQLLPFSRSVLEMTSRRRARRESLSLAASGFSSLPWQQLPLPARAGLPVFIHFCVHTPELTKRRVYITIYGGLGTMGTGLPPKSDKHH